MRLERNLLVFVLLINLLVPLNILLAREYYIAKNGDDNNPGTLSAPWKTFNKANATLVAGDIVYVRRGTYKETIKPNNSGNPGNFIIYETYKGETVTISEVPVGVDLSHNEYIEVDGFSVQNVDQRFVLISNGHHNIIQHCVMDNAVSWGSVRVTDNSSYNKILSNTIKRGHGDVVYLADGAHHNLVQENDISGELSTHAGLNLRGFVRDGDTLWVHNNIIKGNYFHDADDDNIGITEYVKRNVVEDNIVIRSGLERIRKGESPLGAGIKLTGSWNNVVRRNIVLDNPTFGIGLWAQLRKGVPDPVLNNRIYNNIVFNNGPNGWNAAGLQLTIYSDPQPVSGNIFVNNLIINNSKSQVLVGGGDGVVAMHDNFFFNNLLSSSNIAPVAIMPGGQFTLQEVENRSFPYVQFKNNLTGNPVFVDSANVNYHLKPGSPAIDKGRFLTKVSSSGSGTSMDVQDAGYFIDGFGLIKGDMVQLEGQTEKALIVNIDYRKNLLILDRPLTWSAGQGVSLSYSGAAPDIGVFEFTAKTDSTSPIAPLNVSVEIQQ